MQLIPAAESWSHTGTTTSGALCLHGRTAHARSTWGLAEAQRRTA
jgi:hypothetical protein